MKKGQTVLINLSLENAQKSGIAKVIVDLTATVIGPYENGVTGHYYNAGGKIIAIADKYNAAVAV